MKLAYRSMGPMVQMFGVVGHKVIRLADLTRGEEIITISKNQEGSQPSSNVLIKCTWHRSFKDGLAGCSAKRQIKIVDLFSFY